MSKSYLVVERGLAGERVFHLQSRLTIGRAPESDIHLPDPSVSRQHALVYVEDEKAILEDMGSRNGTYVNEERVKKAVLSNGDTVRIGNVTVQFLQEEGVSRPVPMHETQEIPRCAGLSDTSLQRSRRLVEAVSNILLFSSLDREDLDNVCKSANLLVCNPGRPIIRHGEWGDSLYIILDGRMRVFTYDHQGKDITLELLGENHFFGEIPLLTGNPHMTSVEPLEETFLCKLSFETIRDLAERHPIIKDLLEQSHRDRLHRIESRRESLGFERRRHPRYEIPLTVIFSVSPDLSLSDTFQRKTFQGISADISLLGVRVRFKEKSLRLLPMGWNVRLEIVLPPPWQSVRCIGIVKHMIETDEGDDRTHIGIEFSEISSVTQRMIENFLYRCVTAETEEC
jgi:pSer/pThr/pTyr-binding forkhead associated (FHA) protein